MSRTLVALAVSGSILVACSWLVQIEGDSYRRRLRETGPDQLARRLVQTEKSDPPRAPLNEPGEPPVPGKVSGPMGIPTQTSGAPPAPQHPLPGSDSSTRERPHQAPAASDGGGMPPRPKVVPSPQPNWPADPITGKDPLKLTRDEEARLGKALHELIIRDHQLLGEDAEPAFLNRLYQLCGPLKAKDVEPSFYIVDSNEVFAFSHVGGYIYLSRRLARLIPDDVELEFIIAHEMVHLEKRHGIEQVAGEIGAQGVRPNQPGLVQRLYHQIAAGYDAQREYDADASAGQRLISLGRSTHRVLSFLRRFENYEIRNPRIGPMEPETPLDAQIQNVERHWRTHPRSPMRLRPLQELTDRAPAKSAR